MRKWALVAALCGMVILSYFYLFYPSLEITSKEQIKELQLNRKVIMTSKVIDQTDSRIYLNNNISIKCESCKKYENKTISVVARVQEYKNTKYLEIISIN